MTLPTISDDYWLSPEPNCHYLIAKDFRTAKNCAEIDYGWKLVDNYTYIDHFGSTVKVINEPYQLRGIRGIP